MWKQFGSGREKGVTKNTCVHFRVHYSLKNADVSPSMLANASPNMYFEGMFRSQK